MKLKNMYPLFHVETKAENRRKAEAALEQAFGNQSFTAFQAKHTFDYADIDI